MTFEEWYEKLCKLSVDKGCEYLIPPLEEYPKDGFENELSPEEELCDMFSYLPD